MDIEYEHRYLVDRECAEWLLSRHREHTSVLVYDRRRPISYARTVYFDTDDLTYYQSFEREETIRLRIRQYAQAADLLDPPRISSPAFLELKRSIGARRSKVRVCLDPSQVEPLFLGQVSVELEQELRAQGAGDLADRLRERPLSPRLMTWYRRLSIGGDGLRITFDEAIAYCQPDTVLPLGKVAEPTQPLSSEPQTVLEVKVAGTMVDWLRESLDQLPVAADHSKYRAGMTKLRRQVATAKGSTLPLPVLR